MEITGEDALESSRTEYNLLKECEYQHVLKAFDYYEHENYCYIFTELVNGVTLLDVLSKYDKLPEAITLRIFHQFLSTIIYL